MFKVQNVNREEKYICVTFTDGPEAYGAIVIPDDKLVYIEFMEFKGNDIEAITADGAPEEYKRLKDKYMDDILSNVF